LRREKYNNMEASKKQTLLEKKRDYAREKRMSTHEAMHRTPNCNAQRTGCLIAFCPCAIFLKSGILIAQLFLSRYITASPDIKWIHRAGT
jgi:hypothetical protein